jgi:ComF family protein
MRPIAGGLCSICGERLVSAYAFSGEGGEPRCGLCRRLEPPFARATAYSYEGGLRDLIHLLKYEQVRPAANVLGRMLAEAIADLDASFSSPEVLVVAVPLYSRKERQRGFNQSELIARVAVKLGSSRDRFTLDSAVLVRCRETQSQTGLTRHQRRENIRGAFLVAKPDALPGREVLLVDDVFTTGTTASECARVLRRAGALKVWVATVARTLKAEANHGNLGSEMEPRLTLAAAG